MSFIKKEVDGVAKSDLITIIVIAALAGGIWFYTKQSKAESYAKFDAAQELSKSGSPEQAYAAWTELQNASFKNDSLDSILYENLSKLEELKINNQEGYRTIRDWVSDHQIHKVKIQKKLALIHEPAFLQEEEVKQIKAWREQFGKYEGAVLDTTLVDEADNSTLPESAPVTDSTKKVMAQDSAIAPKQ